MATFEQMKDFFEMLKKVDKFEKTAEFAKNYPKFHQVFTEHIWPIYSADGDWEQERFKWMNHFVNVHSDVCAWTFWRYVQRRISHIKEGLEKDWL